MRLSKRCAFLGCPMAVETGSSSATRSRPSPSATRRFTKTSSAPKRLRLGPVLCWRIGPDEDAVLPLERYLPAARPVVVLHRFEEPVIVLVFASARQPEARAHAVRPSTRS